MFLVASLQLFVLFWTCCIASIIPFSSLSPEVQSLSIDSRPSSASEPGSLSSLNAVRLATFDTTSPDTLDDMDLYWYAQCRDGLLAKCATQGDIFCANQTLQTSLSDCAIHCVCVGLPKSEHCFSDGNRHDCWGSLYQVPELTNLTNLGGNDTDPLDEDDNPTPDIGQALGCAASPFVTACWQNRTDEQTTTSLKMCPFMYDPVYYTPGTTWAVTASTANCIGLLDLFLSPELPATYLTAQQLYNNVSTEIADYQDCHLFVSGGENATAEFMTDDDVFYVGNYDLADAALTLIQTFAESGNISTFGACGRLEGCPVMSLADSTNKTGQIGFRFCIGGADLDFVNFSFGYASGPPS